VLGQALVLLLLEAEDRRVDRQEEDHHLEVAEDAVERLLEFVLNHDLGEDRHHAIHDLSIVLLRHHPERCVCHPVLDVGVPLLEMNFSRHNVNGVFEEVLRVVGRVYHHLLARNRVMTAEPSWRPSKSHLCMVLHLDRSLFSLSITRVVLNLKSEADSRPVFIQLIPRVVEVLQELLLRSKLERLWLLDWILHVVNLLLVLLRCD